MHFVCSRISRIAAAVAMLSATLLTASRPAQAQNAPIPDSRPALSYSHHVFGSLDRVNSAAVGVDGTLYVAGVTLAKSAALDASGLSAGAGNPFVARLSGDGSRLLYLAYLDKSGLSEARSLTVDGAGNVFVTGTTRSDSFPTLHALRSACSRNDSGQCRQDAFVAKLDTKGVIVFATRLGGSGDTAGNAIALDSHGNIFVGGSTNAYDFATTSAAQTAPGGSDDGFVASVSADGSQLRFVSYLGGSGSDEVRGLAVTRDGAIIATGATSSADFPTRNAFQSQCRTVGNTACQQAFVAKLSADGTKLEYSSYLGGSGHNTGNAVAVDADGYAYVAGTTNSSDFPGLRSAQAASGSNDAFAAKIAPDGSALQFATLIGGKGSDRGNAIAVDFSGTIHVAGSTQSVDFPTHNPLQSSCGKKSDGSCSVDGFVATLDSEGKQLQFSTYLGGQNSDVIRSIAMDRQGSAYVAGWTSSPDFPTSAKSATPQTGIGKSNAGSFVAKIAGLGKLNPQVTCGSGTNNWTGTAGDNQWTTATNWSTGAVPVATDNVCIDSTFTSAISVSSLNPANQTIASLNSGAPLAFQTGPLTISGAATFAADLNLSGGYWTLNGASTMTTLELSSGVLAGSGTFTISGLLTWQYGWMCTTQSSGTCTAPGTNAVTNANGGINFSSYAYADGRTINTVGTTTSLSTTYLYMYDGSVINNPSGSTWKLGTNALIIYDQGGTGTNTFSNAGALQVAGTAPISIGPAFSNSGSVSMTVSGGTLTLGGAVSGAGTWALVKGATLAFSGGGTSTLTGTVSGAGNVNFQGGTITLAGALKSYNVTGSTTISGATTTFKAGVVYAVGSPLTISGGVAEFLTNNIKAKVMNLTGGVYSGTGTLTISGLLTWSYGWMCTVESGGTCTAPTKNAVTSAKAGINFPGGYAYMDGRTLNTYKTSSNPSSQYLYMYDGSVIANEALSTWNMVNPFTIYDQGGKGTNKITNAATFECTGGASCSVGPAFSNTATGSTVSVSGSGSNLTLGGSVSGAGSWAVATGTSLNFAGGNSSTLTGPISGAGTVNFVGGTITLSGAANSYNVTGTTTISGATATFSNGVVQNVGNPLTVSGGVADFQSNAITVPSLALIGGVYAGTGTLTISGALNWSYGWMCTTQSAGNCTAPASNAVTNANAGISFGGGYAYMYGRTLNTALTSSNPGGSQYIYMYNGSVINNQSGATWNLVNPLNIYDQGGTGTNTFNNAGTFEATGGASYQIGPAFNNPGAVSDITGNLGFSGVTGGSGTWAVGSGSVLTFQGVSTNLPGSVSGAGSVIFAGGIATVSGPANSYNVTGSTGITGATTTFSNGVVQSVGSLLSVSAGVADFQNNAISVPSMNLLGGIYAGTGTLTVSGTLGWTYGWMCATQTAGSCTAPASNAVTNANAGVQFGGGYAYMDGRTLNTSGNSSNGGGAQYIYMYDGSTINNPSGATWNVLSSFNIYDQGGIGTNTFNNAGTVTGAFPLSVGPAFNNSGSVSAGAAFTFSGAYNQTAGNTSLSGGGTLTFSGAAPANIAGGSFSGAGTVTGPISSTTGTLAPGTTTTAGTITLSGTSSTYSQGSGASYNVKIGGTADSQHDRTLVGGAATLGGTLNVTLIGGYTPPSGTNFTIMTYASESGVFAMVPAGWSVTYKAASLVLTKN